MKIKFWDRVILFFGALLTILAGALLFITGLQVQGTIGEALPLGLRIACIALGILKGDFGPGDLEGKEAHYARVQRLAEKFKAVNGSMYCRDIKREDPVEKKKYCTQCVVSAVEALLEELEEA